MAKENRQSKQTQLNCEKNERQWYISKKTWLLFEENKNYVSKQKTTGEGLLCLHVFLGHLCLLIWTQHCSPRRNSLKFRQLGRVQFCVTETRIHVFASYSKMPACIYFLRLLLFQYLFHFEIILVSQKSAKSNKVFQCSLCLAFHVLLL